METILQNSATATLTQTPEAKADRTEFWANAEFNRFGISPAILTFVVCISSFAAAFAITSGVLEISLVGFPTAIFITSIISIAPMRVIFSLAAATVLIDIVILAIHLI